MTEVVSDQSSVVSGRTADPLAEAICPHCGYSLRGLPENRCPECGNAFDPAEVLATFRPKWPLLMRWFLLSQIAAVLVTSPFIFLSIRGITSQPPSAEVVTWIVTTSLIPGMGRTLLFTIVGTIAVIGMGRCRQWGRTAALATFAGVCLVYVLPVLLAPLFQAGPSFRVGLLPMLLQQSLLAIPFLLVILFLTTGLRRRSLASHPGEQAPLLSRSRFSPRRDWPLLIVVIVAGSAVRATWLSIGAWNLLHSAASLPPGAFEASLPYFASVAAEALWLWTVAVLMWIRPRNARVLVVLCLVAVALGSGVEVAAYLDYPASGEPMAVSCLSAMLWWLASVLPVLSLVLFAFRDLTEADVRLVATRK